MGRSFYRPNTKTTPEDYSRGNPVYHHFQVPVCDGKRENATYQRPWRLGYDGKEIDVEESRVDYVMGSGNHARTYLHRTERGTLVELPLAWYAGKWRRVGDGTGA